MGVLCNKDWDIAIFRAPESPQGGDIIRQTSRHLVCMREERITQKSLVRKPPGADGSITVILNIS